MSDDLRPPRGQAGYADPGNGKGARDIPFWLAFVAPALGMVPLVLIFLGVKFVSLAIRFIGNYLEYLLDNYKFIIVLGGALIAYLLFKFRKYSQFNYGFFEVLVAIMAISNFAASDKPNDMLTFIEWATGFLGPVYIAVRGFTNMDEARQKRKEA